MSQPEISPLARRLAEENNVDWRDLHGSGAGGKVVERDVLEYLARVMAGEEDLDPTPEPVPEGMEAWPEEDVHSFQQEMRASSKNVGLQEIQQELSASDRLTQGASAPDAPPLDTGALSGDADAAAATDDISEDIFLFDDEDAATPPAPEAARPDEMGWPTDPRAQEAEPEDALLVAGEDGGSWEDGLDDGGAGTAEEEALWADAGEREASERLPDVFGGAEQEAPAAHDQRGEALFDDGGATTAGEAERGELHVPPLGDLDLDGGERAGERYGELHGGAEGEDRFVSDFEADFDTGSDAPADDSAPFDPGTGMRGPADGGAIDGVPLDDIPSADAPLGDEADVPAPGSDAPEPSPGEGVDVPTWSSEPAFEPFEAPPAEAPASAEVPPSAPGERAGVEGPAETGAIPSELPLVSYGTLLRRHVDVTALASAQLAVGLELGDSEPLPPGPFLLRAAAKAVADGAWGDGPVAMIGWDERGALRVGRVADAGGRPFVDLAREVAAALSASSADAAGVSLAVADMSALEVDEAVLNVDAPLLTLGRILYDNQRGSYRSTLSLAGDVAPERGARLLARVAELLDAPVRLLL